jgi:hypothetical protein
MEALWKQRTLRASSTCRLGSAAPRRSRSPDGRCRRRPAARAPMPHLSWRAGLSVLDAAPKGVGTDVLHRQQQRREATKHPRTLRGRWEGSAAASCPRSHVTARDGCSFGPWRSAPLIVRCPAQCRTGRGAGVWPWAPAPRPQRAFPARRRKRSHSRLR